MRTRKGYLHDTDKKEEGLSDTGRPENGTYTA